MRSFLSELKRRNVYRVGATYAVTGWLIVQVATQVLPIFNVSALVLRIIVILVAVGFPIALVLAWVYEVRPEGIVRTDEVERHESITRRTGRKLDFVIIALLAVAVLYLAAQRWWLPRGGAVEKSIAVLPFENLSDDKSNAYFAQGIQDEIITRLAKVGALKVISRTSTQHYASSPNNLPEIARELGVANILEGSVQKSGDAVHINVQLIRAATDDHLWADVYDRKLDNIFGVEGEVAGAIADKLNARLSGAEQAAVEKKPTENLAAYDAYLRGRAQELKGYDYDNTRLSIAAYSQAVKLDPKFALAWSRLSPLAGYLYFNRVDRDKYTAPFVKQAADTALALQPELTEAKLAQATYLYRVPRDFAAAQQACEAALRAAPNNQAVLQTLGLIERRRGDWDRSLSHMIAASALDPNSAGLMTAIGGESLANMRRYAEAREWLDKALKVSPGNPYTLAYRISLEQNQGQLDAADRIIASLSSANAGEPGLVSTTAYQRWLQRRFPEVIASLKTQSQRSDDELNGFGPAMRLQLGLAQRAAGDAAGARATFGQLIASLQPAASQVDDTDLPVLLARAEAYAGDQKTALQQARHAVDLFANDAIQRPAAELGHAEVQMLGGDHDAAIATLMHSLQVPSGTTRALLQLDPVWDPLRGDPRFQVLLKQ